MSVTVDRLVRVDNPAESNLRGGDRMSVTMMCFLRKISCISCTVFSSNSSSVMIVKADLSGSAM
jgi:hypothetical protein